MEQNKTREQTPMESELELQERTLGELQDSLGRLFIRLAVVRQIAIPTECVDDNDHEVNPHSNSNLIIDKITYSVNKTKTINKEVEKIISELVI